MADVGADCWEIRNEFAGVAVQRVPHGLGYRLAITSLLRGNQVLVDATLLDALTLLTADGLAAVMSIAMLEPS